MGVEVDVFSRIDEKREQLKMSKKTFCESVGVGPQAYAHWSSGDNSSYMKKLPKIAEVLDCPLDYLLTGKVKMPAEFFRVERNKTGVRPVIGDVCAGRGTIAQESIIGYAAVESEYDNDNTFWLRVTGDSMSPYIDNGDLVLVDRDSQVTSGNIVVAIVDGENGVIKRLEVSDNAVALISLNPTYPPMVFVGNDSDRVYIVGRVVKQERVL